MKIDIGDIPEKPGVYILKDHRDRVIYIGKAKNLKNRIKTYFQRTIPDQRREKLSQLINDINYIITKNEIEALILEANLIKQFKPRFNVLLRDDKNYPYLRLTISEEWPRIEVARRIVKNGSLYFGPYVPAHKMWEALSFIRRNFPIRTCKYDLSRKIRPCIQYQMGRCIGPCKGNISHEDYMKIVDEVRLFLKGQRMELLSGLEARMKQAATEMRFEEAARLRDKIKSLSTLWESQRVVAPEIGDVDVIDSYKDDVDALFIVFFIRNGIVTGVRHFFLRRVGKLPEEELFHSFIEMFYSKEIIPPDEILVRVSPADKEALEKWLSAKKGSDVKIVIPYDRKGLDLLKMATENALQIFDTLKKRNTMGILPSIEKLLNLPRIPSTIGAFDVSTLSGSESVGAFVYWADGRFIKDLYRRLRIREVTGVDDYSMMREIVKRTLSNLEDKVPDLIIIDGGKGQLEIAKGVIEKEAFLTGDGKPPMVIAIAKDPDRVFTPDGNIIELGDKGTEALFLKKIRDEVHRFAISYHRKLRDKRLLESPLERIKGIGKKRRLELLRVFGSIEGIRNASIEEIAKLKGFNKKIAQELLTALRR
ncbi:MAG: excinuclease ABC subunit UvrC [Thermodesulfovibrionales bacterium]